MNLFKDVSESQFWLTIWSMVIAGVVLIASIIGYVSYQEDLLIKQLVEKGSDPIELSCLYHYSSATEVQCLIIAQNKAASTK